MKKLIIVLLFAILCGGASGQVSVSAATGEVVSPPVFHTISGITQIAIDWTSDATNDATITLSGVAGILHRVSFNPDAGGTQPDDNYDVTISDVDGVQLFTTSTLDETNSSTVAILVTDGSGYIPTPILGDMTIVIGAAGAGNGGIIRFYFSP